MLRTHKLSRLILLCLVSGLVTACDWFSDAEYFSWKLQNADKKTYNIKVLGTAVLTKDLFGIDPSKLSREGIPVTLSVKNEAYLTINKVKEKSFELQLISGDTSFSSFPDMTNNKYAQGALRDMFESRSGIELAVFEMGPKGSKETPDFNRFLSLNLFLRLPDDSLLQQKRGNLPSLRVLAEEEMCLDLYNRRLKERETSATVILNSLTKNADGDMIAEMSYRVVEKVLTEYQEGDFAKRRFIKRFNDANIFADRKLRLEDDEAQKTFICEYNARHFFNLTKGWLEGIDAEQSIKMIKTEISPKAAEIFRIKAVVTPYDKDIKIYDSIDDILMREPSDEQQKKQRNGPTVTDMLSPQDGGGIRNLIKQETRKKASDPSKPAK